MADEQPFSEQLRQALDAWDDVDWDKRVLSIVEKIAVEALQMATANFLHPEEAKRIAHRLVYGEDDE